MATETAAKPGYTTVELLTLAGPEHRRVSTAPPRPATLDEIPIIDLRGMKIGSEEKAHIAAAIRAAATDSGFFYIKNHGIPQDVIESALRQAKALFSQPDDVKMRVWSRNNTSGTGYTPAGTSQINRSETKDRKEAFLFRYEAGHDPMHSGPLREPEDWIWDETRHLDGFKEATVAWWQHCLALARGLLRLLALALDLSEDYFDSVTTHPGSDGLYICYPGTASSPDEDIDVGIGSHTDIQCFTLLWQDPSGGLQVLSARDEWLEATPIEGTLVVNIADFLQRLSNNRFRSTVHRVYNRQPAPRFSMPFFFGFNLDAVCSVVPTCVDDEHPPLYEPISCGKWRADRFALARASRS